MRKAQQHLQHVKNVEGKLERYELRLFSFPDIDREFLENNITKVLLIFSPFHYPEFDRQKGSEKRKMKANGFVGFGLYVLGVLSILVKLLVPEFSRY